MARPGRPGGPATPEDPDPAGPGEPEEPARVSPESPEEPEAVRPETPEEPDAGGEPESREPESAPEPESGAEPTEPEPEPTEPGPTEPEPTESDAGTRPWWASPAPSRLTPTEPTPVQPGTPRSASPQPSPQRQAAEPPVVPPATPQPVADPAHARGAATTVSTSVMAQPDRQRTPTGLAWAAGVLLAIVILFALFFLGQRIGSPAVAPTPTPTPTPSPTAAQEPGVHVWNTMFGGECLQPYTSPWDHDFTVVDCATPHAAQLVYRGRFDAKQTEFPGEKALSEQINDLCSAAGIVDLDAARDYPHLVVQGSYPITQRQWEENPYYYCFVSSSSGQQLTADIAGPGPKPAAASPAPTASAG